MCSPGPDYTARPPFLPQAVERTLTDTIMQMSAKLWIGGRDGRRNANGQQIVAARRELSGYSARRGLQPAARHRCTTLARRVTGISVHREAELVNAELKLPMTFLQLVAIVVHDYDPAIRFFVHILGFELVEDSPSVTTDGRPKRWVVVRPPGAQTGLLLARADGERQAAVVGEQHAGRVGFFLRVDDFAAHYERMVAAGVEFARPPRMESYGQVAVFLDIAGNRWDLIGPARPSLSPLSD